MRDAQGELIPIYDPFAPTIVREAFPNNIVPETRVDPGKIGRKLGASQEARHVFEAVVEVSQRNAHGQAVAVHQDQVLGVRLERDAVVNQEPP